MNHMPGNLADFLRAEGLDPEQIQSISINWDRYEGSGASVMAKFEPSADNVTIDIERQSRGG